MNTRERKAELEFASHLRGIAGKKRERADNLRRLASAYRHDADYYRYSDRKSEGYLNSAVQSEEKARKLIAEAEEAEEAADQAEKRAIRGD